MRAVNSYLALILLPASLLGGGVVEAEEAVSGPYYMFRVPLEGPLAGTAESGTEDHPPSVLSFFANGSGDIQQAGILPPPAAISNMDDVPSDQILAWSSCTGKIVNGRWLFHCPGGPQGDVIALRPVASQSGVDFQLQSWTPFSEPSLMVTVDGFSKTADGIMVPEGLAD